MLRNLSTKKELNSFSGIISKSSLPRLEVELLLSYVSKKDRLFIMTHPEYILSDNKAVEYKKLEAKRLKNWPIAYLLGTKAFFSLDFKVTKDVLVPRPETETMVEEILNEVKSKNKTGKQKEKARINFFDVGTGSGAIIISLASVLKEKEVEIYKQASFFATDISSRALTVAKENAKTYKLLKKIDFKRGNLLQSFKKELISASKKNEDIIIAANLPYLKPIEMTEISISREPKIALLSGANGLKHYQELFIFLSKLKQLPFSLYCEINPGQTKEIKELSKKHFFKAKISIIKDLTGRNRFCKIKNIL